MDEIPLPTYLLPQGDFSSYDTLADADSSILFKTAGLEVYIISEDKFYYWDGSAWVQQSVTGTPGSSVSFVDGQVPTGLIDGVNGAFSISQTPLSGSLRVYLNGLRLKNNYDYTHSGTSLTMSTIPFPGDVFQVDFTY